MLKDTADALYVADNHKAIYITPKVQFTVGNFSILPFELEHDVPNIGFLISDGEEKPFFVRECY